MDWIQFIIFIVTIGGLFLWNRSEARNDYRHLDTKIDVFQAGVQSMIQAIQDEMKDFHGRLCSLEARKRKE